MKTTSFSAVVTAEVREPDADALAEWVEAVWGVPVVRFERPGCSSVWLELYFSTPVETALAQTVLARRKGVLASSTRVNTTRDWRTFWKKNFHGYDAGRRLRISPPWDRRAARERVKVVINPGLGFGTGEHFTTRFCLEMIDHLCEAKPPTSLLDIGTGSGILAIAAAKLGVKKVAGCDIDDAALNEARANAKINGVGRRAAFAHLDITSQAPDGSFDVVCANLFANMLVENGRRIAAAARHRLVLSGIREHETDMVADVFAAHGWSEIVRDGNGEWSGLLLKPET
jgi:ribosomal protein L11 methyltransferase